MSQFNSKVLERLSRRDAFSKSRASYLQKFANLSTTVDVEVKFGDLPNPARCSQQDGEYLIEIDQTKIVDRCKNQGRSDKSIKKGPLNSVSNGYLDAFIQEGLLNHELGHVLFTDFDALNDVLGGVSVQDRQLLQQMINVFEDAVIEIFLRQYYDCGTQLLVKNKIFHDLYHRKQPLWKNPESAEPVVQATLVPFEYGRYESGVLDEFNSMAIEKAKECFYDVIQEPDAKARYERIRDLYDELSADSNQRQSESQMDRAREHEPDDSNRRDEQQKPAPSISLDDPDEDEEEGESGSGSPLESDEEDEEEDEEDSEGSGSGESSESEEDAEEESEGGSSPSDEDDDESEEESSGPSGSIVGELDEEDVEELEQEAELNPDENDMDNREESLRSEMKAAGFGNGSINSRDPDSYDADSSLIRQAERRSRYLSRVVEDHFTPKRGDGERRNQTHGRFDSRNMIDAARGSPRVFKTEDQPDEPDFTVVLALDDSGSMQGPKIEQAASAATTIGKAFEDAGGGVYFYRFARVIKAIKTPSMSYDECKEAFASEDSGGGTGLFPLLEQYDEISEGSEDTFLFVITDGRPGRKMECVEELKSIEDPTATLQIDDEGYHAFQDAYDAFQVVDPENPEEIKDTTESLIRRLVETRGSAL